jgi:hypothetical protein
MKQQRLQIIRNNYNPRNVQYRYFAAKQLHTGASCMVGGGKTDKIFLSFRVEGRNETLFFSFKLQDRDSVPYRVGAHKTSF